MSILGYHAVDPQWSSPLSVHPTELERQLTWLAGRRTVIPLTQAVTRLRSNRGGIGSRCVALTFDDAFASVHEHAVPLLRRLRLPATVFVVARAMAAPTRVDWVDDLPRDGYRPRVVTADEVVDMHRGGIDIQSHGLTHRTLTGLSDAECLTELRDSRQMLEDLLHSPVTMLAYPREHHDERIRRLVRKAGYRYAFGTYDPRADFGSAVDRAGIYGEDSWRVFRLKTSPLYLPFRHSGLVPLLRPAVHRLRRRRAA